jgi:hypothetical protein
MSKQHIHRVVKLIDVPLSIDEKIALARAPISVGILASTRIGSTATSAGCGERPSVPVLSRDQHRIVGTRARKLSDGSGGY